ncbi:hypothetical protein A2Z00_03980 [Candidatus Gottesmanbacteria bacterium RBG_13_45_10]|uniref:Malate dehydrogenase n=1 Tax=Candidatus Gottesmanbacteria bacterium RBG_13_45_10 TaxID=1798370 RepID=A0A1F5ZHI1_9BACT|nr:MAG: hypothetical protein A2Z00_03980 [Candidatus Gottesmanbacteria bacterium RBG_13_45_10]
MAPAVIRDIGLACFRRAGVSPGMSRLVVESLVVTSLRGVDSHGIRLIPHYVRAIMLGRVNMAPRLRFHKTLPGTGILEADNALGIIAGTRAMEEAIRMGNNVGMGAVAVAHSSHFGAAGLYTIKAAKRGMIGFACTHVEALVLPPNGKKPFLGTNAISIAVPCAGEDPICLDMATTTMTLNKLMMYRAAHKKIPEGLVADKNGRMTTDPTRAVYLTHFGSYKGYGFAFMVDMFSSMLSGMPWGPHLTPMFPLTGDKRNLGHFFWAINIKGFQKLETFKRRMRKMADELRTIPSVTGDSVMVPGDPEKHEYDKRIKSNRIPIPQADYASLCAVAKELGVTIDN